MSDAKRNQYDGQADDDYYRELEAKTDIVDPIAAETEVLDGASAGVTRPRELESRYLVDVDVEHGSTHMRDELEPTETLCGLKIAAFNLEGFTELPLWRKSCETCLRLRRRRDDLTAELVDKPAE